MDIRNRACPLCGGDVEFPRKEVAECFQWPRHLVCCSKGHLVDVENCGEKKRRRVHSLKNSPKKFK